MQGKIIVGLGFRARSGKDTLADILGKKYGFKKTSFATSLKEGIGRGVFGFSDEQLYGDKKEVVDEFWNERLNIYEVTAQPIGDDSEYTFRTTKPYSEKYVKSCERLDITPRLVLQLAGTEAGREVFGDQLWVETVARRIQDSEHSRWVIPDLRFPNEAKAVLRWGGDVYRVDRDEATASGGASDHASETSLLDFGETSLLDFDGWTGVIDNNGSLDDLREKARQIFLSFFRGDKVV